MKARRRKRYVEYCIVKFMDDGSYELWDLDLPTVAKARRRFEEGYGDETPDFAVARITTEILPRRRR